jgi:hypothetical protein
MKTPGLAVHQVVDALCSMLPGLDPKAAEERLRAELQRAIARNPKPQPPDMTTEKKPDEPSRLDALEFKTLTNAARLAMFVSIPDLSDELLAIALKHGPKPVDPEA